MMRAAPLLVAVCACSKGTAPAPPPQPIASPSPAPSPTPADASVPIDAWLESAELGVVPPPAGTVVPITERGTVTAGDITITFTGATHKHLAKGGSIGEWYFTLARDGQTQKFELESRDDGTHPEGEVAFGGAAFVIRHVDYTKFEVVTLDHFASPALDQDACVERIQAVATRAGLPPGRMHGYSTRGGIVTYDVGDEDWRGHCGTLSQRVWLRREKPRK